MRANERKILAAITANPGMLWYEAGARVYPVCVHSRVNIFGETFEELYGRGLSLAYSAIHALADAEFVTRDENYRYRVTVKGRRAIAKKKP